MTAWTAADPVNVSRVIDDGPFSRPQVVAIALCSLVAFLDGVDSQSIAIAAPIIVDSLQVSRTALGPVFSAGLLGATFGALLFGPLGDRFGRKRMLIAAAAIFGVFTLATATVASLQALVAVRFLAGIGLGGATPCFIALASEFAPRRRRAMVASLIWAAFPLGGALGGFINAALLKDFGWRAMFYVGGVLPLLVAAVLAVALPESLRYLLARNAPAARVAAVLNRLRPGLPSATRYVADEERAHGAPLRQLFADGRAGVTLLLWVPFFMAFGVLAITVVWTPVLLRDHGIAPTAAGVALGVHGLGALIGMGAAGRLLERFGAVPVLVPALLLGAVFTGLLGYAAYSLPVISAVLFLIGISVGTGASGSIALAALTYPTSMRSSGIGWAMGMGRFGQVFAPLFATWTVAMGWNGGQTFLAFALAPLIAALAVLALRRNRSTVLGETRTAAPG